MKHPTGLLKIGKQFENPNLATYSKVTVDELSIWNRQLTQAEIETVMQMAENPSD